MIEAIFVVMGFVIFLDKLFEKWFIWDEIEKCGSESNFEWFFNLTRCRFCLLFHLSWIVTLIYAGFNPFGWGIFAVPFVVSGLIQLILKK